jgi:hypothetical protein
MDREAQEREQYLHELERTIASIRERFVKILKGEPVFDCPLCENKLWVDEHLCCSDMPHMPEYHVLCHGDCPLHYELHSLGLNQRGEILRLYYEHFVGSYDVWLYVVEQEYKDKGIKMPSRGNRPTLTLERAPKSWIMVYARKFTGGEIRAQLGSDTEKADCYFSRDGGKTALPQDQLQQGDVLYWNMDYAGYDVYSGNNLRIEMGE